MNKESIASYLNRHETVLRNLLQTADIPAVRIKKAMHYVLFPGGKRLRPMLVYLCGELVHVAPACLDFIAAAVELTHAYSLIHDDLPAMDNDDFRRGKLSCHRAFDEATAILVGDGLQAFAIEILLKELSNYLPPIQVVAITKELVSASGPTGMVSGQSLDLSELQSMSITEATLRTIHTLKTGKLISACVNMVLAAADSSLLHQHTHALRNYAAYLGLVFQMQDDYLDEYAPLHQLGKNRASDNANQKTTFARLYSQSALATLIAQYFQLAKETLLPFAEKATTLLELTDSLRYRSEHLHPDCCES